MINLLQISSVFLYVFVRLCLFCSIQFITLTGLCICYHHQDTDSPIITRIFGQSSCNRKEEKHVLNAISSMVGSHSGFPLLLVSILVKYICFLINVLPKRYEQFLSLLPFKKSLLL